MNFNHVVVIGRLTKTPELRVTASGTQVCAFNLATNRVVIKDGQRVEEADFLPVVCFGKTAESLASYLTKDSTLLVEGRWQSRFWEQDGQRLSKVEILGTRVRSRPAWHAP
jgi:single-strand DNA-binding protein